MDREKVIKGLECHQIDNNHRINCTDCPYYVDDDSHIRCVNDLHDDAIELLKEQEPVKPISYHRSDGTIFKYECRKCRTKIFKNDQFCRRCGRSAKWNG